MHKYDYRLDCRLRMRIEERHEFFVTAHCLVFGMSFIVTNTASVSILYFYLLSTTVSLFIVT
jgi:hypothetical protein